MAIEQMYSIVGAAQKLGVSTHTISAYLRDKKITRTKIGRRTLIRESELSRLLSDGGKAEVKSPIVSRPLLTQELTAA